MKQNGYLYYYADMSAVNEKGKVDIVDAAKIVPYSPGMKGADPPPRHLSADNAFVIVTKDRSYTCVCEMPGEAK